MASLDELYAKKAPQPPPQEGPLDLHEELLKQYAKAKSMLSDAELEEAPLNYRTQTLNSISALIGQIVKMQSDLHTLDEIKKIENALIETLKSMPDVREEFLKRYKGNLTV